MPAGHRSGTSSTSIYTYDYTCILRSILVLLLSIVRKMFAAGCPRSIIAANCMFSSPWFSPRSRLLRLPSGGSSVVLHPRQTAAGHSSTTPGKTTTNRKPDGQHL